MFRHQTCSGMFSHKFDLQVCATYYDQHKVTAEIKTVQAVFEKSCKDEQVST